MAQDDMQKLTQWFKENEKKNLSEFFHFLSFPSISTDPEAKDAMKLCSEWVKNYCEKTGLTTRIVPTPSYPIVFAEKIVDSNAPTVMLYGHYDVQPADPLDLWDNDPFVPTMKDGIIYARGALDNKGQAFYVLLLLRALSELNITYPVNIKLCIEGEEESGSEGLATILSDPKIQQMFSADYLLVVDSDIPGENIPGVSLGARGISPLTVTLKGSDVDLHSGHHGGLAYNPIKALVEILAKMWDEKGKIALPNFYDDVHIPHEDELAQFDMDLDRDAYHKNFGIHAFSKHNVKKDLETTWFHPSLEINGICGGYTGEGFKTVIPAVAHAKISCRLVPDQTPEKVAKMLKNFLSTHTPEGMDIHVECLHGGAPVKINPHSIIVACAMQAYQKIFHHPCKKTMVGGSIPIVANMVKSLGCEPLFMGMGLSEDNIHAPNEHFGWDRMEKGFLVIGEILRSIKDYI